MKNERVEVLILLNPNSHVTEQPRWEGTPWDGLLQALLRQGQREQPAPDLPSWAINLSADRDSATPLGSLVQCLDHPHSTKALHERCSSSS